MLFEILKQLKDAIKNNDKKSAERLRKQLYKLGVDDITINYLLSQL